MAKERTAAQGTGRGWVLAQITIGLVFWAGGAWAAYTDNGNGAVTDTVTGLVWQQAGDNQKRNLEGAISYCEGLTLAGFSDWHLPDVMELKSITDDNRSFPSIDPIFFPGTKPGYWSSSSYAGNSIYAWYVDFEDGAVSNGDRAFSYYVRCVRSGTVSWHFVGVQGQVTDSGGQPLTGVSVATETGINSLSDSQGHYALTLAPCAIALTYSKPGFPTITRNATVLAGQSTSLDVALSTEIPGASANSTCATVDANLTVNLPCVGLDGHFYQASLNAYRNQADPSGLYWQLGTVGQSTDNGSCASADSNLNLNIPCVSVSGIDYSVNLNRYVNLANPFTYYWSLGGVQLRP